MKRLLLTFASVCVLCVNYAFALPRDLERELARTKAGEAETLSEIQVKKLRIYKAPMEYPSEARAKQITGSGVIVGHVSRDGKVDKAWMGVTTGSPLLDQASVRSLKRWRFKRGHDFLFKVPLTFSLTPD